MFWSLSIWRVAVRSFVLKHLAGQHDQRSHGSWAMTAGMAVKAPTKGRAVANPIDGKDGTDWSVIPQELRDRQSEVVSEAYPHLGADPLSAIRDNVLDAYDKASADVRGFGERWYAQAHNDAEEMARNTGYSVPQCAGAISAMSPKTGWESNVLMAHYVTDTLHRDPVLDGDFLNSPVTKTNETRSVADWCASEGVSLRPGDRLSGLSDKDAAIVLRIGAQRDGDKVLTAPRLTISGSASDRSYGNGPPLTSGIEGAVHILRATDVPTAITETLNGHKTRSFYNNIVTAGGTDSVTIDAHALDAAILGYDATHSGNKAKKIYKMDPAAVLTSSASGLSQPDYGSYGTYSLFAEGFRAATRVINEQRSAKGLEPLTPAQVQAIVWIATLPPTGRE